MVYLSTGKLIFCKVPIYDTETRELSEHAD